MLNILTALYIFLTSSALISLKLGSKAGAPVQFADGRVGFNLNLFVVAGILLYGVSFIVYMYLVSKLDLGYIIPITTACVYILIFTASYFIFHETFTIVKIIGILLVLTGIILLNIK